MLHNGISKVNKSGMRPMKIFWCSKRTYLILARGLGEVYGERVAGRQKKSTVTMWKVYKVEGRELNTRLYNEAYVILCTVCAVNQQSEITTPANWDNNPVYFRDLSTYGQVIP